MTLRIDVSTETDFENTNLVPAVEYWFRINISKKKAALIIIVILHFLIAQKYVSAGGGNFANKICQFLRLYAKSGPVDARRPHTGQ